MSPSASKPARIYMVMRLLHGRTGGAERLFLETANLFAEEGGHDVTCLHCDARPGEPYYPLSAKVERVNLYRREARRVLPYRVLDALAKPYPQLSAFAPAAWLAKNGYFVRSLTAALAEGRPDLVISFLPPANTVSLVAGSLAGVPVIPTNHNVPERDFVDPARWDQNPIDKKLRLAMLRRAARVHVLFPTFADWFPPDIRSRVIAIPNYVSAELDDVVLPAERPPVVMAAGRLAEVKNYLTLVDAWAHLANDFPQWRVEIYGDGPERGRLDRRIREHGLADVVALMGHEKNMKRSYLNASVFAHPALYEGFGLSVAEALHCGLPVVAFADCPGVNEFVFDGDNGVMADRAGGVEAYAAGLRRLLDDSSLLQRTSARAPASVERFSRARFLARWNEVIDEVRPAPPSA